ncbi:hypothetical protein Dip518_001591 [Parelusimicrobium proximum]|uniref:hypothetical protein n=1 Tax=Parelusimicrobium proximum TaxID=3228953 RepID=UPI003D17A76D
MNTRKKEPKKDARPSTTSGAELYNLIHEMLDRRDSLLPLAKEFSEIDHTLKTYFRGVPAFTIGRYSITGAWETRPSVHRHTANKGCPNKSQKIWKSEIKKI